MMTDEDPFESIVMMEKSVMDEGFEKGFAEGKNIGQIEGASLGRKKGKEAANDFGYYYGFSMVTLRLLQQQSNPTKLQMKSISLLSSIIDRLNSVSLGSYENTAAIVDCLEVVRKQHKQVCTYLRLKHTPLHDESKYSF